MRKRGSGKDTRDQRRMRVRGGGMRERHGHKDDREKM
jgi:hypothetical protein